MGVNQGSVGPMRHLLAVSGLRTARKTHRSRLEECKKLPYSLKDQ